MQRKLIRSRLVLALAVCVSTPAIAGDPSAGWGTAGGSGGGGNPVMASSAYQNSEMKNAQMVTMGKNVTIINNSITSCGSCTYYSITGNENSIAGNNVNSINSGETESKGAINTFFATNILPDPTTGASLIREATTSGPPAVFTTAK